MPPRTTAPTRLSGLIGSDSEPDFDNFDTEDAQAVRSASRTMNAAKPRGRPPSSQVNRISKPAQRGGRGRGASKVSSRGALSERNKNAPRQVQPDTQEHEEHGSFVQDEEAQPPQRQSQSKRGRPKAARGTTRKVATQEREAPKTGRGRPPKAKTSMVDETPETHPSDPMALDDEDDLGGEEKDEIAEEEQSEEDEEEQAEEEQTETLPATNGSPYKPRHAPTIDHKSSDAVVRRQLGELKRRYEGLETRHTELKEVGVKAAERNYERLRKQADENSAVADKLIAELKAEVAAQKQLATRGEQSENDRNELQAKVRELSNSLTSARSEIQTLTAKLAAARNTEAAVKVPGSALKANLAAKQTSSMEAVQAAQAKEDLYGDLTGLIIRGMKHDEQEDVFDCIQTGRNGTLHFKLALDSADEYENYEDVQYTYRPQLEASRDGDLIEILPDYLQEEITFPRPHASKFFARVTKFLMERLE